MQIISIFKNIRNNTVRDLKNLNSQSLAAQVEKGKHLAFMMPANNEDSDLIGEVIELSTENESLKNKKSSYDRKWLQESKTKFLKQFNNKKRANLIMSKREKQKKITNKVCKSTLRLFSMPMNGIKR